jgi:hypothetical protein
VIAPPHDRGTGVTLGQGSEYRFFSEDLSLAAVQPFGGFTPLSAEATESTPYLRHDTECEPPPARGADALCYQPLVTAANTREGVVFGGPTSGQECVLIICGPRFVAGSPDLSYVVVSSPVSLTSTSVVRTELEPGLYEWSAGKLDAVGILPAGESGSARLAGTEGADVGISEQNSFGSARVVSNDDGRVILVGFPTATGAKHLYLRDPVKGETIRIDAFQGVTPGPENQPPEYMNASTDASRIFFLDSEHLTPEASSTGQDLYEYNLNAPEGSRVTDLTVDSNVGQGADVSDVLGVSEDGSYVYFAAGGVLAPGGVSGRCPSAASPETQSACNIYVRHDGETRLVTTDWEDGPELVRVSPNGEWLTFMSSRELTGYDTRDAVSGQRDEEVYLYHAESSEAGLEAGRLVCASCDPTGARPTGVVEDDDSEHLVDDGGAHGSSIAAALPAWTHIEGGESRYQPRYLSDSGRLFFNAYDALVPQDTNGTWDVYEYEPDGLVNGEGKSECGEGSAEFGEQSQGCVNLISSGTSGEESAFLDASTTGGDAFFLSTARLVPQAVESSYTVYDAHECTSSAPCLPAAAVTPPPCVTEASCKPAATPQPSLYGAPASATFSGAGNLVPPAVLGRAKPVTRAQMLAKALTACRKDRSKRKRASCEKQARRKYGTAGTKIKAKKKKKSVSTNRRAK